ncbi:hypothetical protein [Aeromonas salmonicida]|uniref:hypothetical protein n=1 Tax=Aeromonas salmonicida TaxID=645 RepID=UPI003D211751
MKELYLLVCEGASDIAIIKAVSEKMAQILGKEIEIRELSPTIDATTQKYPDHGWKKVQSWCEKYGDNIPVPRGVNNVMALAMLNAKGRLNWRSILKISNAKGLIIHLDTDIAHHLYVNGLAGQSGQRQHCSDAISSWLGIGNMPVEMYYLLPSYSTENWLLAKHDHTEPLLSTVPQPINYEAIIDPSALLISGGYKSYVCPRRQRRVLSKDYNLYEKYGADISAVISKVALRCDELDRFCSYLI